MMVEQHTQEVPEEDGKVLSRFQLSAVLSGLYKLREATTIYVGDSFLIEKTAQLFKLLKDRNL